MMKPYCPGCESLIDSEQLNVATDVAVCANCNEVFTLSSLVKLTGVPEDFDINDPPSGAWFEDRIHGWSIGASTRSKMALFLVPFMCVWSGFSLGGIYGKQIIEGKFDLSESLFGIPFLLGTLVFGSLALMTVIGREEVTVEGGSGQIFTGVGPIGWTRRFNWDEVSEIMENLISDNTGDMSSISLRGKTRVRIGSMFSDVRRYYVLQGLRTLRHRDGPLR